MSLFHRSNRDHAGSMTGALTQGGQTSLHGLHMLRQVTTSTMSLSLMLTAIFWLGTVSYHTPYRRLYALWSIIKSWLMMAFSGDWDRATQWCAYPGMTPMMVSSWAVSQNNVLWHEVGLLLDQAYHAFIPSLISFPLFWVFLMGCWVFRGFRNKRKRLIEGDTLLTLKQGQRVLKKTYKPSQITLAGMPLPESAAQRHVLIAGTTGAGKTNALRSLLSQIRAQGDRALVIDLRGSLLAQFYEPSKDTLLNPFDKRSPRWNVFDECEQPFHRNMMAQCLVPSSSTHETFWTDAARTLLVTGLQELKDAVTDHPHRQLLKYLIQMPLAQIYKLFRHTMASSLLDPQADRMAVSIRATLTTALESLLYCEDGSKETFSVRRWVQDERSSGWLWLVAKPDQRAALTSMISAWFATAISALKSMPESKNPRLWIILDELPQLGKLPALAEALEEIRAFGGCLVAGLQDVHQLDSLYGHHTAQTLLSLFNTKVLFRMPNHEVSARLAGFLGKNEISEKVEHISYGSHAMRDGVSLNDTRKVKFVVEPQALMALKVGEAILKTLTVPPIKLKFKESPAQTVHPDFLSKPNLDDLVRGGNSGDQDEAQEDVTKESHSSAHTKNAQDAKFLDDAALELVNQGNISSS